MRILTLNTGYKDAQAFIATLCKHCIISAIANLSTPINESDVPEILTTQKFLYAWFRYLHFRKNVFAETLTDETIRLQLEFLAGEEQNSAGDAIEILTASVRNHTKSLYPVNKREGKKHYGQRTSRATRNSKNATISDTVMVAIPSGAVENSPQNNCHG